MEEEKRLDVEEIIDIEKRVDVLEGQPETPLVCPIFKTDLDNINDRITVLEGDSPSEIKNPMRLSELGGFEERVEELEDQPTPPEPKVTTFNKGDRVIADFSVFAEELLTAFPDDLHRDLAIGNISSGVIPTISIAGTNGSRIDICYATSELQEMYIITTNEGTSALNIRNDSNCGGLTNLDNIVTPLIKMTFNNPYTYNGNGISIYSAPQVTVHFADGTNKEAILSESAFPLSIYEVENPIVFDNETVKYNVNFNKTLNSFLTAEQRSIKIPAVVSGTILPQIIALGPNSDVAKGSGKYNIIGTNILAIGIVDDTLVIYDNWDGTAYKGNITPVGSISCPQETYGLFLLADVTITNTLTLSRNLALTNPAKIKILNDELDYETVNIGTSGENILPIVVDSGQSL